MPNHPNPGLNPDEEPPHDAEGIWYMFRCGACDEMTYTDTQPEGLVTCEACGYRQEVVGTY